MRLLAAPALLLTLLTGCASPRPPDAASGPDACRAAVDANLGSRLVAPAPGRTGLCNVNGGMTLCRGAVDGAAPMQPLSAHEQDRRAMLQDCRAAQGAPQP